MAMYLAFIHSGLRSRAASWLLRQNGWILAYTTVASHGLLADSIKTCRCRNVAIVPLPSTFSIVFETGRCLAETIPFAKLFAYRYLNLDLQSVSNSQFRPSRPKPRPKPGSGTVKATFDWVHNVGMGGQKQTSPTEPRLLV